MPQTSAPSLTRLRHLRPRFSTEQRNHRGRTNMSTPVYSLIAENMTTVPGNVVLYQTINLNPPIFAPVAFDVVPLAASATVPITLPTNWSFFWTTTPLPPLVPGVVIKPSAITSLAAQYGIGNQTIFSTSTGTYAFAATNYPTQ